MKKYLTQLLTDLHLAHRTKEDWEEESAEAQTIEKHFEDIEAFFKEEEEEPVGSTFGGVCGIDKEAFPPAAKLKSKQLKTLSEAIDELFWTWNISMDLPDSLPLEQVYFFQVEVFDMQLITFDHGMIEINFCEDDFNLCVFGEDHCDCKKWWEEMEEENQVYDKKVQEFIQDLGAKLSSSAAKVNFSTTDHHVEILATKVLPIKTLAEWFDISMDDFPDVYSIWEKRANHISELIMGLFPPEDKIIPILQSMKWDKRFTALKRHLESKVWFDGIVTVYFLPLTEEEKAQMKSPLDFLMLDDLNLDDLDLDSEDFEDEDLPF